MSTITPQQLQALLPLACKWAEEQEQSILHSGEPLTQSQLADARLVGVKYPERIRLLRVEKIPMPKHPALAAAVGESGLFSSGTEGMTLRYGIFIRADCWEKRLLHVHEFVHTTQYERLGGFEAFLDPYLRECFTPPGYPHGPMEREAVNKSARVLSGMPV